MPSKPIAAIIVNYHTEVHLLALLTHLSKEELIDRIVVVDNSATFAPPKNFKNLVVLCPQKNIGFGSAVNLAAEQVNTPYLLILNPDVRPLAGSIKALYTAAKDTGAAVCGPRFFWDEKKFFRLPPAEGTALFWEIARNLASFLTPEAKLLSYYWRTRQELFWLKNTPFEEPFLSGAALLLDRKQLPGPVFDPRFFLYFEDTDLSLRLNLEGKLQLCVPQAEMIHFWNQSPDPPPGKRALFIESRKKFFQKYYSASFDLLKLADKAALLRFFLKHKTHNEDFYEDLGPLEKLPPLGPLAGKRVELALNPLFIPFAHTDFLPEGFERLPDELFGLFPPGRYFLRVVDVYGRVHQKLTFSKTTPRKQP